MSRIGLPAGRNLPVFLLVCCFLATAPAVVFAELIAEEVFPGGEQEYELGRGNASRLVPVVTTSESGSRIGEGQEPASSPGFEGPWLHRSSSNMFLTVPENLYFPGVANPAVTGSLSMTATGGGALIRNASRRIRDFDPTQTLWFAAIMQVNRAAIESAESGVSTSLIAFLSDAPANFTNWNGVENRELAGIGFGLLGNRTVLRYQSDAGGAGKVEDEFFPEEAEPDVPYLFLAKLMVNPRAGDLLEGWLLRHLPGGGESSLPPPDIKVRAKVVSGENKIRNLAAITKTPHADPVPGNSVNFDAIRLATSYEHATGTNPFRLRTITYNVFRYHGWPRSEENRDRRLSASNQIPARIAGELLLYQPDIVTLQEADSERVVAEIADRMGMDFAFFPSKSPRNWPGAVLSRFRIVENQDRPLVSREKDEDDLFTRHWGKAVLDTPVGEVVVHSAHLHPWTRAQDIRLREITLMLESIDRDIRSGRGVILQGDLNFRPDTAEHGVLREAGFTDSFLAAGEGREETIPADEPTSRIDYVFVGGRFRDSIRYSRVLYEGAFRTNPADPDSFALSDHLPVLADIKFKRDEDN